jgi:nanoRNase/pAp phosphatase (c-di-AMP/oligoRNAs hydrolase)
MKEVARALGELAGKRVVVLCHHNADPDAACSAVVLSEILRKLGAEARAGVAESTSLMAKSVLGAFGKEIEANPSLDCDAVLMVDTSGFGHLGSFGERVKGFPGKTVVIDHHRPSEETKRSVSLHLVDESYTSEAELIFDALKEMGLSPTPEQASLLLAGIISDTAHFRLARPETFEVVWRLLECGADYRRVLDSLKLPEDPSKRVAMLRAIERSEFRRIYGYHFIFSELGSFEGDAAAMMVKLGADAAFVGSEDKGRLKLSGRARSEFIEEIGIHLGEVMERLGQHFSGSGGGHAGAASMTGTGKLQALKRELFRLLERKLGVHALQKGD